MRILDNQFASKFNRVASSHTLDRSKSLGPPMSRLTRHMSDKEGDDSVSLQQLVAVQKLQSVIRGQNVRRGLRSILSNSDKLSVGMLSRGVQDEKALRRSTSESLENDTRRNPSLPKGTGEMEVPQPEAEGEAGAETVHEEKKTLSFSEVSE
jgi:hypothetical protein